MAGTSILVSDAVTHLKGAFRQGVSADELSDSVLDAFAQEFVADLSNVLTSAQKWEVVKPGLSRRARALGTLAAVYAGDERVPIDINHLRMALGVVKQGCTAVTKPVEEAVLERYRIMYEGCRRVPTL